MSGGGPNFLFKLFLYNIRSYCVLIINQPTARNLEFCRNMDKKSGPASKFSGNLTQSYSVSALTAPRRTLSTHRYRCSLEKRRSMSRRKDPNRQPKYYNYNILNG